MYEVCMMIKYISLYAREPYATHVHGFLMWHTPNTQNTRNTRRSILPGWKNVCIRSTMFRKHARCCCSLQLNASVLGVCYTQCVPGGPTPDIAVLSLSLYLATLGNRNCQVLRKYIDPVANRMASNTFHYLLSKAHSYFIYRNRGECKLFMLSRDISLLTHHYTSNTNCIMEKWLLVDVKIRGSEGRRVRCDEPTSSDMATDSRSHTQMCVVCPDIIMSLTPFLCNSFLTGSSFDNTIFILSRNIFR